ncbi:MAG: hypothetical protein AB1394_13045 [Bacteroidota bacterium]
MLSKIKYCLSLIALIFTLGCEREVFTGYEEQKPENNKLHITSNPPNAKFT